MLSRQAENASLCCTALSQIQESEPQIFLLLSSKYLRSAFASIALGMEQFFFCCHIYPACPEGQDSKHSGKLYLGCKH